MNEMNGKKTETSSFRTRFFNSWTWVFILSAGVLVMLIMLSFEMIAIQLTGHSFWICPK